MGNTTTFTDLIAEPISEKIFLLEINVAETLTGWESILVIQPPIYSNFVNKLTLQCNMALITENSVCSNFVNKLTLQRNMPLIVKDSVCSNFANKLTLP